jgi:hypothetical protein
MKVEISKIALALAIITLVAAMAPPTLIVRSAPITVNLQIVADAPVSERNPDTNYGTYPDLVVRSSNVPADKNCRSYIRADLSSIAPGAKVITASLKLYSYAPPAVSRTYQCWRAVGAWSESTITWNTIPKVDSVIGYDQTSATISTSAGWVTWDVKNTVQKFLARDAATYEINNGWYVRDSSENSAISYETDFRSREYSDPNYRPRLELSYYAPALFLDLSATSLAAGNWVKMTVTRKDYDGNLITRGALYVDVSSTSTSANKKFAYSAGGASITTVVILNGASSRDFYYYDDKVGAPTIGVSTDDYAEYGSDSDPITVVPGAPAVLDLTPPSATIGAGGQYSSFTVTLKDAFGQTTTAPAAIPVNLNTNSPGGQFRQVGTTTQIFSVIVQAGQSFARFDYYDITGGTYTITVFSTGLTADTATITVIPDSVAPTTDLTVGDPKHVADSTTYVGPSTQITLQGIDNVGGSGVKETKYRIDSGGWTVYSGPFTLATFAHGSHTISYMSTDNALNSEPERTTTVFLDKNPPSVSLIGPSGTIWVTSLSVKFEARISDEGSGLETTTLVLDGSEKGPLIPGPTMSLTMTVSEGTHSWTVQARDNVGNVQQPAEITVIIGLDNTPPSITGVSINPTSPAHGEAVVVSANVQDTGSGVQTVVLKYSTDNVNWNTVAMTLSSGTLYQGTIPGQNVFSNVSYYVQATDRLDNAGQSPTASYSVQIPTLWLYAGGGLILLLVVLLLVKSLLSRPSQPPAYSGPPPPPS